jgi:hypothetical protein
VHSASQGITNASLMASSFNTVITYPLLSLLPLLHITQALKYIQKRNQRYISTYASTHIFSRPTYSFSSHLIAVAAAAYESASSNLHNPDAQTPCPPSALTPGHTADSRPSHGYPVDSWSHQVQCPPPHSACPQRGRPAGLGSV